jgi:predicted transcriptional regulator
MANDSQFNLKMRAREIVAIKEGLADVAAGRTLPWKQAKLELRQVLAAKRQALALPARGKKLAA